MAEATFGLALGKLADFFTKEATLIAGIDDDIKCLLDTREWLQPLLHDVDRRRREMTSGSLRAWLCKIRQVSHEIERIVDQFRCKAEIERVKETWPRKLVALPYKVSSWRKLGNRIRRVKKKLNNILADKDKYNIDCCTMSSRASPVERLYRRYNYYRQEHCGVVGLDEDVESLTHWLVESATHKVISIVGMAGTGKSMLANTLFQSEIIQSHFQCYGRIFVSQDYEVRELLEGFMKDAKLLPDEIMKEMTERDLARALLEHLKNKRYLVVIDDIWDKEAWDILKSFLPEGLPGSKIMLTTRNRGIAHYADSSSFIHEMRLLSWEESWKLFCSESFPSSSCPSHLEAIGKEIVARCDGLPLPIVAIGQVLRGTETTYNKWLKVSKNIKIGFQNGHIGFQYEIYQHIQRSLALSYDDLPYELQLCFLFLAAFPEGYVIEAPRIMRLWVSEELIAKRPGLTLEEVAEDYLDDLIQRSMILVEEKTDYGSVKSIRIHNIFLDLARAEANDLNFLGTQNATDIINTHHDRLAIHDGLDDSEYNSLNSDSSKICSLLYVVRQACHMKKSVAFPKWEYLKVVEFRGIPVERLPDDIGKMIYLTYLGLRNTGLKQIPNSIGNLGRLQTIDLLDTQVRTIVDTFWTIQTLRHVLFEKTHFVGTPKLLSPLKDLQTLVGLRSGRWVSNLINAPNICHLELEGVSENDENELVNALRNLESLILLKLAGEAIPEGVFGIVNHPTLRSLKLFGKAKKLQLQQNVNLNLGSLSLYNTEIGPDDIKIIAALPSLQTLQFYNKSYTGKRLLCPVGSFPCLQVLHLDDLRELEAWEVEEGAMCNLSSLSICNCVALTMLSEGVRSMTKLKKLKLARMPTIRHRIDNEDGEDYHKVKHIKLVEFA